MHFFKTLLLSLGAGALSLAGSAHAAAPSAPAAQVPSLGSVQTVTVPCNKTFCDAELWLPPAQGAAGAKPPVIIMAHGFGALRDWGLGPFAERFVKAGFAVLRFDYRGFGKSGGQPRSVVDGKAHLDDWLSVIDAVAQRNDVDTQRLGIWGTSYSGGQVLMAAARRPKVVKAVSAQVPFVSGLQSGLRYPLKFQPLAAWHGLRDLMRADDEEPVYVPVIAEDAFSALVCDECAEGYKKLVPPGQHTKNQVAARVFMTLPWFTPASEAPDIQAPALVIAAEKDGLIPIDGVRKMTRKMARVDYVELPGADHFAPYTGPVFEQVVAKQAAFFTSHLQKK